MGKYQATMKSTVLKKSDSVVTVALNHEQIGRFLLYLIILIEYKILTHFEVT